MLGTDTEKGLAQLKTVAEGKQAAIAAAAAQTMATARTSS